MSDVQSNLKNAGDKLQEFNQFAKNGNLDAALSAGEQSLMYLAKYELSSNSFKNDPEEREKIELLRNKLKNKMNSIKTQANKKTSSSSSINGNVPSNNNNNNNQNSNNNNNDSTENEVNVDKTLLEPVPKTTWSDVVGLDEIVKDLKNIIDMPRKFPKFYSSDTIIQSVILFGPPGTGKTMLASAFANHINGSFMAIRCSVLLDRYVGSTEKNIEKYFNTAIANAPCVMFFDEIDSIARSRNSDESGHSRTMKNELLLQINNLSTSVNGKSKNVYVIAATNDNDIDDAITRRFKKMVYVPLPKKEARLALIKHFIKNERHNFGDRYIDGFASSTKYFSPDDFKRLFALVTAKVMEELEKTTHYRYMGSPNDNDEYEICDENDEGALPFSQIGENINKLRKPMITRKIMDSVFIKFKPIMTPEKLQIFEAKFKKMMNLH
jgi:SpoVK/Ycf46/Vps4 family AAA+-type ATPase